MAPKIDFAGTAQKLSRNPLGIIGLFLVLVYGIAALVFGFGGGHLDEQQTWVFVIFLAVFPILVLAAFVWLVIYHHTKLYSPGDFREDQTFLSAMNPTSPVRLNIIPGAASEKDVSLLVEQLDALKALVARIEGTTAIDANPENVRT